MGLSFSGVFKIEAFVLLLEVDEELSFLSLLVLVDS
jgi:hypothetical protein